jgi:hypothetical protein
MFRITERKSWVDIFAFTAPLISSPPAPEPSTRAGNLPSIYQALELDRGTFSLFE